MMMNDFFDIPEKDPQNTIIKVEHLTKLYGANKQAAMKLIKEGAGKEDVQKKTGVTVAVNDASFEVQRGEIFVLIGLSGSGKSTVIRCLNMLNRPTYGNIFFEGKNIAEYDAKQLLEYRRNKISMVFQNFGLMSHRDVLGNVAYGLEVKGVSKSEREKKAMEMIAMVGLDGWEDKKIASLSGGMRQRVGIARALTNEPDVLLMDEPFSALDPLVRRDMQFELLSIQQRLNKTVVFITHDINEAFKLGSTVGIMRDGKIIQIDTPERMSAFPKDEYVSEFINSADKSKIFSAKHIMDTPSCLIHLKDSINHALNEMRINGVSSAFVIDDKMKFVGLLPLEQAISARAKGSDITSAVIYDVPTTNGDTQVSDLMPIAAHTKFPIAVVDENGRLEGIVTKAAVLSSIT